MRREFILAHASGSNGSGDGSGGSSDPRVSRIGAPRVAPRAPKEGEPGWAAGLRKLYNSVVDEPLPSSFENLLRKLDESGDD